MSQSPQPVAPLSYSQTETGAGSKTWAGFAIAFVGLVLIGLGGCFLIGILVQLHPNFTFSAPSTPVVWSTGDYVLQTALYVLAFVCFASGAMLIFRGVVGLSRIMWNSQP